IGPLGGLTVTVTDGTITRTTSTLTVGAVGTYRLPQLPLPGTYTVSVTGPGWLPQTTSVDLSREEPNAASIDFAMVKTTAAVTGTVTGVDTKQTPDVTDDEPLGGLNSVGITANDGANIFKTTSAEDGVFEVDGLPPGTYVLTFDKYGFASASATVNLVSGDDKPIDDDGIIVLQKDPPQPPPPTAVLQGTVTDVSNPDSKLDLVDVAIVGQFCDDLNTPEREDELRTNPCSTRTNPQGFYQITGAPVGAFTVTFGATAGYVSTSRTVQLPATTPITLDVSLVAFGTAFGTVAGRLHAFGGFGDITDRTVLQGVTVRAYYVDGSGRHEVASTETDANGGYELLRVFDGAHLYFIEFHRTGFIDRTEQNLSINPGGRVPVSVQLARAPEILGTVVDSDPFIAPSPRLADVTVTITGPIMDFNDTNDVTRTTTTNVAGLYRFYLCNADGTTVPRDDWPDAGTELPADGWVNCLPDAGIYSLTYAKDGFGPEKEGDNDSELVFVAIDSFTVIDQVMFRSPVDTTTGSVFWLDGDQPRPVVGAELSVDGVSDVDFNLSTGQFQKTVTHYSSTSDQDGAFTIPDDALPPP
ncbi:MAG: carboxypeptidase regulatory-like domain-containing protein, partial [Acidimicrobiales bacterium]